MIKQYNIDKSQQCENLSNWPPKWVKATDLKALNFDTSKLLGSRQQNSGNTIYKGMAVPLDEKGTVLEIAVKNYLTAINDDTAYIMRTDIAKLYHELLVLNITLPQMELVKVDGGWLFISQFYPNIEHLNSVSEIAAANIKEAAAITAAEINAGFAPTEDILLNIQTDGIRKTIIPLDVDYFADKSGQIRYGKFHDDKSIGRITVDRLNGLVSRIPNSEEYRELVLEKIRDPELRENLKEDKSKSIPDDDSPVQ